MAGMTGGHLEPGSGPSPSRPGDGSGTFAVQPGHSHWSIGSWSSGSPRGFGAGRTPFAGPLHGSRSDGDAQPHRGHRARIRIRGVWEAEVRSGSAMRKSVKLISRDPRGSHDGRALKLLTVLAASCLVVRHGPPEYLTVLDNGPEFTAKLVAAVGWGAWIVENRALPASSRAARGRTATTRASTVQAQGRAVERRDLLLVGERRLGVWSSNEEGASYNTGSDPTAPAAAFPRPLRAIKPSPWCPVGCPSFTAR